MDKAKALAAIDEAFTTHVSLLFGVLLADGGTTDDSRAAARQRFNLGMANAVMAHDNAAADTAKLFSQ